MTIAATVAVTAGAAPAPESTATAPPDPAAPLRQIVVHRLHPWLGRADLSDVADSLRAFYARRQYQPVWTTPDGPTPLAQSWLHALLELDDYGLPAVDFDVPRLRDSVAAMRLPLDAPDQAALDAAFSATIARGVAALHDGRVSPSTVDSALITLHRPLAVSRMLDSLSTAGDPRLWLERVQPSIRHYWLLLQALQQYRSLAADSSLVPARPVLRTWAAGHRYRDAGRLRHWLGWAGDLKDTLDRDPEADTLVDRQLVAGLTRFQRRHDLPPTGRPDTATWARLPAALDERIQQMGRSLEYWRWLPHDLSAPLVLVDIPAFRLDALERLDQPESDMLRMNVVVGTAFSTQTPVFTAAMVAVQFCPPWDVPPTIAAKEILPELAAHPGYLDDHHMVLIAGGDRIRTTRSAIQRIGHGVHVQQLPGPDNPLGQIKFVMPNLYDVYLHDSPARELFRARKRDYSHGCIRLGDAPALARWTLRDRSDWPAARIDSARAGTKTLYIRLPRPPLVAIVYATAEAHEDGSVEFHPDVYGHDHALEQLIAGVAPDSVKRERARLVAARAEAIATARAQAAAKLAAPHAPPGAKSSAPPAAHASPGPPGVPPPAGAQGAATEPPSGGPRTSPPKPPTAPR